MYFLKRVILLFFFLPWVAFSQEYTDTLWNIHTDEKESVDKRVWAIDEMAWELLFSQPDSARKISFIALGFAKKHKQERWISEILSTIGVSYFVEGKFPKAIEFYQKSLKLRENAGDKKGIAAVLGNIGNVYNDMEDFDNAIKYQILSLEIDLEIGNKSGVGSSYNNVANAYKKMGRQEEAKEYYLKSLAIKEELGDKQGIANTINNLGDIEEIAGNFPRALEYYQKSYALEKELGNQQGQVLSLLSMASLYEQMKDYKKVYELSSRAKNIAEENNFKMALMQVNYFLYQFYKATKPVSEALIAYEAYIQIRDSVHNEESKLEISRLQLTYEFEKKATEDSLKNAQEQKIKDSLIEVQKATLDNRNTQLYGVVGGLMLIIVFSLFIVNRVRVISAQKKLIEQQKSIVDEKNKEITDSINYAKRIQAAILPPSRIVKEMLPDSFIIYKPKDIVAGDFYWMHLSLNPSPQREGKAMLTSDGTAEEQSPLSPGRGEASPERSRRRGEVVFFAAADCTGHGVPGAMVSVICNNGLNRSVREYGLTDPGKILDKTREIVIQEFEKSDEEVKDGMDISLCALEAIPSSLSSQERAGVRLHYAGANNPLWVIRRDRHPELVSGSQEMLAQVGHDKNLEPDTLNFELHEVKADKQPIGKYTENKPFTTHTLELQKGDTIYVFTDGYADQFGGETGKKFKSANFKKLLLSIQDKSMDEQQKIITETFSTWKGETDQVDDVCVIGVRV
jgi:tetratricopeptide (TPR) repeat protein